MVSHKSSLGALLEVEQKKGLFSHDNAYIVHF